MDERYLAAQLLTPKSSRVEQGGNGQRELLFESRQLRAINEEYEQSPKTFDDTARAAMSVASLVRETLDFAPTSNSSQPLQAEIIAETEVANCFGHTIVTSECLERLGIEHFISYANQHTFITLFDRQSDRSFMIDVKTRELCCEMTGAVGRENPLDQLWRGQLRAENSLFTDELLMRQLPQSINRENFLAVRGWLRFPDPQLEHRDSRRGSILQMFTLPSIPGRLLLLDEYNARINQLHGKYEAAASTLVDLPGLYLDVDPRNSLEEVGKLCKRLIAQGYDELAIEVARMVDESLPEDDHSKNKLFLPDVMRRVAKENKDIGLMEEAVRLYESLPRNSLTEGKLRAAKKDLYELMIKLSK